MAKEVTPTKGSTIPLQSRANVTVYLDDENDNPPVFLQDKYEAEIPENVTAGTVITQVLFSCAMVAEVTILEMKLSKY